jgi:putative DNA primase/helicase
MATPDEAANDLVANVDSNADAVSVVPTEPGAGVPAVDVGGGDVHRMADEAWSAMITGNDPAHPQVFVRGGDLTRISRDEERVALKGYSQASLVDRMSQTAQFVALSPRGDVANRRPPQDVAAILLDRTPDHYSGAPRVNRVVDVPVFAPDGELLTTPGYHAGSRTYYAPSATMDVLPAIATDEWDVYEARAILEEAFGDFCYADDSGFANALAFAITPFVREMIAGPVPAMACLAHEVGTGKTLLAKMTMLPGCGSVAASAEPKDHEEWRKTLTAALLEAPSVIWYDNLRHRLDAGPLAAVLTAERFGDRVLGHSRRVESAVRNLWILTANNLDLSTELARRSVPVFLDANVERPWERDKKSFRHPDLLDWAQRNRAQLVWACLVLCRSALESWEEGWGYVPVLDRTLASYERWTEVVGRIVAWHGYKGFLGNIARLYDTADEEQREVAAFIEAWHARTTASLTVSELVSEIGRLDASDLRDALPSELHSLPPDKLRAKLPYFLRANRGRVFGGLRLERLEDPGKRTSAAWVVAPARTATADEQATAVTLG